MGHDDWDEATKAASQPTEELGNEPHTEKAYLIVLSGNRLGSMVEVHDGMVIGRSHGTDFQIPEDGISRQHVRIRAGTDGKLSAEDMGSLNGLFVNGQRVQNTVLTDGDKIRIGSTTILKFSYADRLEEHFQQQLREAALRDPLTRIFNRRSLDDHLSREVAFARRHGSLLSLILFDIDHFKDVNDTYGHPAGDELLCGLATTFGRQIRQEDILARYGGEEFALLCRGIGGPVAYAVADRLRLAVASLALVPQLPDLRVTVSGGVAAMPDAEVTQIRELVEAADQALYEAKRAGRNRIVLHRSSVEAAAAPPLRPAPGARGPVSPTPVHGVPVRPVTPAGGTSAPGRRPGSGEQDKAAARGPRRPSGEETPPRPMRPLPEEESEPTVRPGSTSPAGRPPSGERLRPVPTQRTLRHVDVETQPEIAIPDEPGARPKHDTEPELTPVPAPDKPPERGRSDGTPTTPDRPAVRRPRR